MLTATASLEVTVLLWGRHNLFKDKAVFIGFQYFLFEAVLPGGGLKYYGRGRGEMTEIISPQCREVHKLLDRVSE